MAQFLAPTVDFPGQGLVQQWLTGSGDGDECDHEHGDGVCDTDQCEHGDECTCNCGHEDCCDACAHEHDDECCGHEHDEDCCSHPYNCDGHEHGPVDRVQTTDGCTIPWSSDPAVKAGTCAHGHVAWLRYLRLT